MSESSTAGEQASNAQDPSAELVDVCIIGGGIAGVVAALRAQELGLSLKLVEAKRVLHTCHPAVGDAIESASDGQSSAIDLARSATPVAMTREAIEAWKQDLLQREVPVVEGAHVFAVEREKDGSFCSRLSEPAVGRERRLRSRSILIATGASHVEAPTPTATRAAPPRDLVRAVDEPALVVGDCAEAIATLIEISDAKARAGASSPVYWCARLESEDGDTNGKDVGAASGLGDRFLAATLRNQNIRSLPGAQSLNPLETPRTGDWLALVVAETEGAAGARTEQVFEFERDCVHRFDERGERSSSFRTDPAQQTRSGWELLAALSVRVDRRDDESLLVVDVAGRLSHAGLYAAGAVRGDEYLLCAAFIDEPKPGANGEVRYEKVRRSDAPGFAASEAVASVDAIAHSLGRQGKMPSPASEAPATETQAEPRWSIVRLNLDGTPGARFELTNDVTEIGRAGRDIEEPEDTHMADHQASLVNEDGEIFVADSGRGSGVWLRIDSPEGYVLEDEDQVWLGAQILVATKNESTWTVVHYGRDGLARETYAVGDDGIFVGRESGHVLDPNDGLLSRRHAQFCVEDGKLKVYDRGARNGTYVKVSGAVPIDDGAEFRVSARGYRLERIAPRVDAGLGGTSGRDAAALAAPGGDVELQHLVHPRSFPVPAGSTILQGFIEARGREGEPIEWECQTGTCGLCVVEVVSGADHLIPPRAEPDEARIIGQTLGAMHASKEVRLACLAQVGGAVVIRSLK